MSILADYEIKELVTITPFEDNRLNQKGRMSYGLSSYGYDIRCDRDFKVFTNVTNNITLVDPKNFDNKSFIDFKDVDYCIIPPNSFALTKSYEHVEMPRNVLAIALAKSSYARCGILVGVTPIEPEWAGHITIEISNSTPLPCKIYSMEGAMQLLFFKGNQYF